MIAVMLEGLLLLLLLAVGSLGQGKDTRKNVIVSLDSKWPETSVLEEARWAVL